MPILNRYINNGLLKELSFMYRMNAISVSGFGKPHFVSVPTGKAIVIRRWSDKKEKKKDGPEICKERDRALIDSHSSSTHSSSLDAELENTTELIG